MLVVTANWGCADGTLVPEVAAGRAAVSRWFAAIHRGVVRAGFRRDGRYEPVEAVDLVFAGDTCDWLVSQTWLGAARPWHGGRRAREARARVAIAALRRAAPLAARVARWLRAGVAVPRADGRGRPSHRVSIHVPVRVAILAGDRDAWLHEVVEPAGLAGCSTGTGWCDGVVAVRHGHEFDPACQVETAAVDRPPSLMESVAVDLVAGFLAVGRERGLGGRAAGRLAVALAAAGPLDLPATLGGWLELETARGTVSEAARLTIDSEWRRAVARWHRAADLLPPAYVGLPASPVAALATWFEHAAADPRSGRRWSQPPAALDDLARPAQRELATAAAKVSARGAVVLGHPSGGLHGGGGRVSQLVCLGAAAEPRLTSVALVPDCARAVAPGTGPVAVAARQAAGRLEWVPLGPDVRDGLEAEPARDRSPSIVEAA